MTVYYNEMDKYASQWLKNLIHEGLIAKGDVDDRDIREVSKSELAGYTQCHFFAGIGGWSRALRISRWPDDKPVWTGSCPCQPFSAAGKGAGFADERHLWPPWFHLIEQCRPDIIFGEQVESAIKHGWLDLVQDDLEGIGYAVGAIGLPAASVGAPHIRQRLWFVADTLPTRRAERRSESGDRQAAGSRESSELAQPDEQQWNRSGSSGTTGRRESPNGSGVGNSDISRSQRRSERFKQYADQRSPWAASEFIPCRDGKARPVEPGTFPLAHGISNRVGRLRAYGNAIVPQVAAEFIKAYMECRP